MIDPYKNTSDSCRRQARERSYENLRLKLAEDISAIMKEQGMSYKDVAEKMGITQRALKATIWDLGIDLFDLNSILDVFSYEMVPILRKRWPLTHN